ncbi:MAG: hypothetical protein KQA31_02815, partial [Candidatus Aenigmarchaeota archaeon]|nr:hypothetical protein [Candidatus Aenigmarchaeota archaeon]
MKIEREAIIDILVLATIFTFLLSYFKPSLIFSNTVISAGDTVGHYYGAYFMNKYLIPHFKLIGWSQDWFLGYPAFQFYFPFVFLLIGFLGYLIPLNIAFKIGTVLGIFLLPICTYFSLKLLKLKFPAPIIASSLVLILLFLERINENQIYSMWGGNIPSTLAGEFAYIFALSLSILFIGSFYYGLKNNKNIVLNSILLTIIMLSHFFLFIFSFISTFFYFLFKKDFKKNFKYSFKLYVLTFLLSSFWFIPMLIKVSYTVPHIWFPPSSINELKDMLMPKPLVLFYILSLIATLIIFKEDREKLVFIFVAIFSIFLFLIAPELNNIGVHGFDHLQLVKFLPMIYISLIINISIPFSYLKSEFKLILPVIVLILCILWVENHVTYIDYWISWNYNGYEDKPLGYEYYNVNNFLSKLPYGRVAYEYDPQKYEKTLGSSRATETIPIFSGKPITEGSHFQSSFNGPYIYNAHCEYSIGCSCLFGYLTQGCPSFDFDKGTEHLKLFGVKYFFASSEKVKSVLRERNDYKLLYGPGEFEIWELNDSKIIEVPKHEPINVKTNNWRKFSYEWFDSEKTDIPLVWNGDQKFSKIYVNPTIDDIPRIILDNDCNIQNVVIENEKISFNTNCINKPHIIKVSYFPNWKVKGADKIYMVSPAFMLVYPKQN